jgi:hypothetical protein
MQAMHLSNVCGARGAGLPVVVMGVRTPCAVAKAHAIMHRQREGNDTSATERSIWRCLIGCHAAAKPTVRAVTTVDELSPGLI